MSRRTALTPRRDHARRPSDRSRRPTLEGLEDRYLLSSLEGGQWTYASRITYSFMPDGTNVGNVPSSLFQTLNTNYTTTAWEQAIEKAAAIWQQVTNINLVQVSDTGEPDGAPGDQQGDPNVGDIRIGAIPMGSGQLAFTLLPPSVNGGTDAGDIFFNSQQTWGGSSGYDLETVAVHEFGHALGLGESAVQQAVMYTYYTGVKTTLNADDTSAIQSLYGTVPAPPTNNHTFLTATNITSSINGNGQIALANEYITCSGDNDFYVVTVPSNTTGTMTVSVQSSNLSSLSPRVTLYNGLTLGLGQTLLANSFGATATYTVNNVQPGQVYYIRASAANTGPGSNGAYGLLVNFGSQSQAPIAPPNTVVPSQPDQGGGSQNELTNGPVASPSGNWWSNWLGALSTGTNGSASSGAGLFRLGSLTAWGDAQSLTPGTGNPATTNLVTGGTGSLPGNQPSSLPTIIAPLFSASSGDQVGALDTSGAGSSDAIAFAFDLVLASWSNGQRNSDNS